jgi:CheY-like chemotaxis protein
MMGGDLTATSEVGKGSTFAVELPVDVPDQLRGSAGPEAEVPSALAQPASPVGSAILVIDDEATARDLVQRALTREGYRVETAASGPEGLKLARQLKPAAITLDVMMPGMDGWVVLTTLKSDPITAEIPVIMMSVVDDKNLGFALGATDYLVKPVGWDRLTSVLEKVRRHPVGSHVLIIEDDPETRTMLSRAAEKQGWGVVEAENGLVGLAKVQEQAPGVILLDLIMPEMDGFTFLEKLRAQPQGKDIPVIVITGRDLSEVDRQRLNGHVVQILQKGGYSTRELLDQIQKVLSAAAAQGEGI